MIDIAHVARNVLFETTSLAATSHIARSSIESAGVALAFKDLDTAHHFATAARGDLHGLLQGSPSAAPGAVGTIVDGATATLRESDVLGALDESISLLAAGAQAGGLTTSGRVAALDGLRQARTALLDITGDARRQVQGLGA